MTSGEIEVKCKRNTIKRQTNTFLKVVQGNAMFLTSIVAILPIMKKGLQSLNLNFGRVLVSKRVLSGHWG